MIVEHPTAASARRRRTRRGTTASACLPRLPRAHPDRAGRTSRSRARRAWRRCIWRKQSTATCRAPSSTRSPSCSSSCRSRCRRSSPSTRCSTASRSGSCHIQVCTNIACALGGARQLVRAARATARHPRRRGDRGRQVLDRGGRNASARAAPRPCVQVNNQPFMENVTAADLDALLQIRTRRRSSAQAPQVSMIPDGVEGYLLPPERASRAATIDDYLAVGGYADGARRRGREMEPEDDRTRSSRRPACAAAAAPASAPGMKWSFMPKDGAEAALPRRQRRRERARHLQGPPDHRAQPASVRRRRDHRRRAPSARARPTSTSAASTPRRIAR